MVEKIGHKDRKRGSYYLCPLPSLSWVVARFVGRSACRRMVLVVLCGGFYGGIGGENRQVVGRLKKWGGNEKTAPTTKNVSTPESGGVRRKGNKKMRSISQPHQKNNYNEKNLLMVNLRPDATIRPREHRVRIFIIVICAVHIGLVTIYLRSLWSFPFPFTCPFFLQPQEHFSIHI